MNGVQLILTFTTVSLEDAVLRSIFLLVFTITLEGLLLTIVKSKKTLKHIQGKMHLHNFLEKYFKWIMVIMINGNVSQ